MKPASESSQLSLFEDLDAGASRAPKPRTEHGPKTQSVPVASSRPESLPSESASAGLLTTQEAAELLRVHPRTVQRLVERGELAAIHVGAAVRFERTDLADLTARLKSCAAGPPTARAEVTPDRGRTRVSFAERLRSQRDEHRAA